MDESWEKEGGRGEAEVKRDTEAGKENIVLRKRNNETAGNGTEERQKEISLLVFGSFIRRS